MKNFTYSQGVKEHHTQSKTKGG